MTTLLPVPKKQKTKKTKKQKKNRKNFCCFFSVQTNKYYKQILFCTPTRPVYWQSLLKHLMNESILILFVKKMGKM